MTADPRARLERMLALLPLIYTAQPRNSAVGTVLQVMAAALARLDDDMKRVLHDRWVGLATGARSGARDDSALESLGHLVDLRRLSARLEPEKTDVKFDGVVVLSFATADKLDEAAREIALAFPELNLESDKKNQTLTVRAADAADPGGRPMKRLSLLLNPEAAEGYRQRLLITTRVTTRGLATPRALLSLAIASLGADPCPRSYRQQDATVAWGVRPGVRRTCAMCSSTGVGHCPNRESRLVEAWITENPPQEVHHQESAQRLRRTFTVQNVSLLPDRPVVRLSTGERPAVYPGVQNRNSGEITLYAGILRPGELLTLMPGVTPEEAAPFDSYDGSGHHSWRLQSPQGRATLAAADGSERDVSNSVFYLWGDRFDDEKSVLGGVGHEEGMHCGVLEQMVRTPRLHTGDNEWMLLTFAKPESTFDEETSLFADADVKDGTRFALFDRDVASSSGKFAAGLLASFAHTEVGAGETDDADDLLPRLDLDLEWVARPPATFRLRVPRNNWVIDASRRGALGLVRAEVEQARAAGVRALVDFPEPEQREKHDTSERLQLRASVDWRESAGVAETGPAIGLRATRQERHAVADGRLALLGRFGQSRLDWSRVG
ncbi:MAG: hypothetical protein IH605_02550 [Burkholderiales bacterium]|nr:hypothetical protein [Burkholderiales bacterium]